MVTTQGYDTASGRLTSQTAGANNAVQDMSYVYDGLGNLKSRADTQNGLTEQFTYDTLNRIETARSVSGTLDVTNTFSYDAIGNITCKSDIYSVPATDCSGTSQNYTYNATVTSGGVTRTLPHAVGKITGTINYNYNPFFTYDANGNMTGGAGRSITWTSFNMPASITHSFKTTSFWYNGEHERIKEHQADGSDVITLSPRYDTGLHFEKKYIASYGMLTGAVEYEHYLYAGGLMFGKYVTTTTTNGVTIASTKTEYYTKDHLGSIVAITDQTGALIQSLSYDVWGKRRNPNGAADPNGLLNNPDMYHGYTGHEMLDAVGLIHMNGRLYDPLLGRFVSADPNIQDPFNLQSYNRYAYCLGNPMVCTDPSGYFSLRRFLRTIAAIAVAVYAPQFLAGTSFAGSVATATGLSTATVGTVGAGMISGAINTGSLQGAITGGLTAGMFNFVGGLPGAEGTFGKIIGHGMVGGISSTLQGGDFQSGFLAAGFTQALAPTISGIDRGTVGPSMARTVAAAIAGGTASVLGGGKFANGAMTGAFSRLFNDDNVASHIKSQQTKPNSPVNGNVGASAQAGFWMLGGSVEGGVQTDGDKICLYAQACSMLGPQFHAAAGFVAGGGKGQVSEGTSELYGAAYFGGAGVLGELQVTTDLQGAGASGGIGGKLGGGAGAVVLHCGQVVGLCLSPGKK